MEIRCPNVHIQQYILSIFSKLSNNFQRDDLPLPRLLALVETAKRELRASYLGAGGPVWGLSYRLWNAKHGESGMMGETKLLPDDNDQHTIQSIATDFAKNIFAGLDERFPSSSFGNALQVLDPSQIP